MIELLDVIAPWIPLGILAALGALFAIFGPP